ncbi:hypothetical protein TNCV_830091 [Trichonephila clavipes]|nr:hypothetical protein TNCV_830091 [Trichonephila clavipes]
MITSIADVYRTLIGPPLQAQVSQTMNIRVPDRAVFPNAGPMGEGGGGDTEEFRHPVPSLSSNFVQLWVLCMREFGKDELKIVAEELNLTVPEGAKIAGLKNLIVNSDAYKNDKELVQSAIDYALAEIKNKRLDSEIKLEFERIKLAQLQKQLELANIQKNLPQNSDIRNPSVFETADNNNVETFC